MALGAFGWLFGDSLERLRWTHLGPAMQLRSSMLCAMPRSTWLLAVLPGLAFVNLPRWSRRPQARLKSQKVWRVVGLESENDEHHHHLY